MPSRLSAIPVHARADGAGPTLPTSEPLQRLRVMAEDHAVSRWRGKATKEPVPKPGTTCVVFTVPQQRLAAMDVATGPCVPTGDRKHALRSVHSQQGPETPEQMAALFSVLTGQEPGAALELIEESGPGRLYRCSDDFFAALLVEGALLHRLAAEESDAYEQRSEELDHAWMATGVWHADMQSTRNRLFRISTVRAAAKKGQDLYCWYGPAVPEYVLASGGPDDLDEYLRAKGSRSRER